MQVQRGTDVLHPILLNCVRSIQAKVIDAHNVPIRLFETGRDKDRHQMLIKKRKTRDLLSGHLFDLESDPPLYTIAVDYVYYDKQWSWNLRDSTVSSWYQTFGNMVLDLCPELEWSGYNRKYTNYCHFQLKSSVVTGNLNKYNCVII